MPQSSYASSVQGVALRATKLDSDGRPAPGPYSCYLTRAFMRLGFTPEYEEGDEITEKNAAGEVCVTYKAPDTLKRVTFELAICAPDPELTQLLGGGKLFVIEGTDPSGNTVSDVVGYAAVEVGKESDSQKYGVALEVWSKAIVNGKTAAGNPYFHWMFPWSNMRPSGDKTFENGLLANTFEGWGVGNSEFAPGPMGDWVFTTDRAYQYARTNQYPTPPSDGGGWVPVPGIP